MKKQQQALNIKSHRRLRGRKGTTPYGRTKPELPSRHGDDKQRVSKIMSQRGICSRREAERLIDDGQVEVDGQIITEQGVKVAWEASITVLDSGKKWLSEQYTIIFNKPRGVLSMVYEDEVGTVAWECLKSELGQGPPELLRAIDEHPRSFHVAGRLDRESRGLMVLTQNGRLVRALTQSSNVEKEYVVSVSRAITTADMEKLHQPIKFDGIAALPMKIEKIGTKKLNFILREGRKHQIRLVCRAVGLRVEDLERTRVGPWKIGDIKEGSWAAVNAKDVKRLIK